jgi:hypothetical protein
MPQLLYIIKETAMCKCCSTHKKAKDKGGKGKGSKAKDSKTKSK